eukprot:3470160-Rhodomonas_salina.1
MASGANRLRTPSPFRCRFLHSLHSPPHTLPLAKTLQARKGVLHFPSLLSIFPPPENPLIKHALIIFLPSNRLRVTISSCSRCARCRVCEQHPPAAYAGAVRCAALT